MKSAWTLLLIGLSVNLPLDAAVAQSSGTSTTTTRPSTMGRWEEFRAREERRIKDESDEALDKGEAERGGAYRLESKQAVLADFADCAVGQVPDRVTTFLATAPNTREEGQALRRFAKLEACTRGRAFVSARTGEMRGAIAEAALKRDAARLSALAARSAEAPARITERAAGTRPFVIAYASCIARAAPNAAVNLIHTGYASDAEKVAIMSIGEPLKACMPEGVAYQLNIRDVRNHVADALYRMSEKPSA